MYRNQPIGASLRRDYLEHPPVMLTARAICGVCGEPAVDYYLADQVYHWVCERHKPAAKVGD